MKVISRKGPACVRVVHRVASAWLRRLGVPAFLTACSLHTFQTSWAVESTGANVPARSLQDAVRVQFGTVRGFDIEGRLGVQWESVLEIGALFFEIERQVNGQWTTVPDAGLPALKYAAGGRYRALDSTVRATEEMVYRVVAIMDDGRRVTSPPATVRSEAKLSADDFLKQRAEPRRNNARTVDLPARPVRPASPINLTTSNARVKMVTHTSGMHWVTAQSLATLLSQSLATVEGWIDSGQLSITNQGLPVTYIPAVGINDTLDDVANGFFFYAESHRDNYSYDNVYWLQGGANTSATVSGGSPTQDTTKYYTQSYLLNADVLYINNIITDPEADYWMMQGLFAGNATFGTTTNSISLDHLVKSAGINAVLKVTCYGGSESTHSVQVKLNGTVLGTQSWSGRNPQNLQFSIASNTLKDTGAGDGENTLIITASLLPGVSLSQVYINSIQLDYPRKYFPTDGLLEAGANSNSKITVSDLEAELFYAFEVTNPRAPKMVTEGTLDFDGGSSTFRFTHTTSSTTARYAYAVWALGTVPNPTLSVRYPTALSSAANRGTYVVISPASLAGKAAALANYRASRLRTKTVLLEDIYDEFNYGVVNPHAIKTFMQTAYNNWASPPRYAVLMGDGTYDYRNLQLANDNLMPPLMVNTLYGLFSTDSLYGDVKNDGFPRVCIGRIPVATAAEADVVKAKIESYESKTFAGPLKAVLIADRPDGAGDFVAGINSVSGYLSPAYSSQLIYPLPYPVGDSPPAVDVASMRSQIQTAINGGVDLVNYIGHGAVDRFGEAGYLYLTTSAPITVQLPLSNSARLPVVLAMTCVAGQYSTPGYDCLAEVLVTQSGSGGVAAIAPTGLSQDEDAQSINRRLMELFERHTTGRLGDFVLQSFSLYTKLGSHITPLWIYNLIGDPATVVLTATP